MAWFGTDGGPVTADRDLIEANAYAQLRFHDMIVADVQGDPDHPLTRAYVAAERRQDDVLRNLQWEKAKAELDALAAGEHFLRPAEVGR